MTPEDEARLNEEQRAYVQETREFQVRVREYEDDRVDHSRNVFIAASILGAAAIVAGLSFFRRIEAMPLGLLLGGFGVVLFGWIQAGDEFNEMGDCAALHRRVYWACRCAGGWLLLPQRPAR